MKKEKHVLFYIIFLPCYFMLLRRSTFWVVIILQRELFGCV